MDFSSDRSYEIIAVATQKGISIWHVGLHPDADGHLSVENIALLSGHQGEVCAYFLVSYCCFKRNYFCSDRQL